MIDDDDETKKWALITHTTEQPKKKNEMIFLSDCYLATKEFVFVVATAILGIFTFYYLEMASNTPSLIGCLDDDARD